MTDRLPPNLLALFAPRPPLRYLQPSDVPAEQRRTAAIDGVADFLPSLAEYKDNDGFVPTESWLERRDRKKEEHKAKIAQVLAEAPAQFNPQDDPNIRGDAFKTLIVARLSYEANEQDLEREFARYGPIERIRLIKDTHAHEKGNKKRKPHRGYAFVVFEREKDMRAALESDGARIKDRRIKVDVERGRTVEGWKPRRLGGGLGGRGYTKAMPSQPMGGRGGFGGGGFRGGFRGGFGGPRDRGFRGGGGRNFSDRGFGGGDRGGGGFGGYRGGGDRGGQSNGYGGASGGGFGGGRDGAIRRDFSGPRGGYDSRDGGGRSFDDRSGGGGGGYRDRNDRDREPRRTGSNMEPIRPREPRENGYRDRDRDRDNRDYDRPRDDDRKRGYEGSYDDPRKIRRY